MPGFLADAHPSTSVLLGYLLAVGLVTSSLAFNPFFVLWFVCNAP